MKMYLMLVLVFICHPIVQAVNTNPVYQYLNLDNQIQFPITMDCDTILDIKGYSVHFVKEHGLIEHIGLNLFSDDVKKTADKDLLNFIEEALLAKGLNMNDDLYDRLVIKKGTVSDFKHLTSQSDYSILTHNSKSLTIEWNRDDKIISVILPTNYDTLNSGSRVDIENSFISRLKSSKGVRTPFEPIDTLKLEPYGKDKFIYPGTSYQNKNITRNVYFNSADMSPVWDESLPLESIANLFIFPSKEYEDTKINLTILKHEYGEKECFPIYLNQFLSTCEREGCVPYWGIEKYDNDLLEGALFLYNHHKGYDHVIKIECKPAEVINNHGEIKARASLFIPTNNVLNLYSPYVKKTEDKKIKYDR